MSDFGPRLKHKLECYLCQALAASRFLLLVGASPAEAFLGPGSLHFHIDRARQTGHILLARDAHPAL